MRRTDREITDAQQIRAIIEACHCCRLGFCDEGRVYIVPLSFGYKEQDGKRYFYFHGATEGRKVDLIRKTHYAGFELDTNYQLIEADVACGYSARYQSVIGEGTVQILEDIEEKKEALRSIMRHNTGSENWEFPDAAVQKTLVFRLEVEELSCKEHP